MNAISRKTSLQYLFFSGLFLLFLFIAITNEQNYLIAAPFVILLFFIGWQYPPFIFFLLIAALPWSYQFHFSEMTSTDIPDEFFMLLSFFFFFAWALSKPSVLPSSFWKHPLVLLLIFHVIWMIVSVSFTTSYLISIKYFLAKTWYISAFVLFPFLVIHNKSRLKTLTIVFMLSLMAVVIFILSRHAATGFTFASVNDSVTPFFGNHVIYGAMIVCAVPVLFACFALTLFKKKRIIIPIALVVLSAALYFSYSRGAWLALLIGGAAYLLIKRKLLIHFFIFSIILLGISFFWLKSNDRYLNYAHDYKTTIYHKDFREHLVATYKLKDVSTAERFYRWIAGVRMIKDNAITGYGPGTFYYNYKPYASPAFKTWVSKNEEHSTVHNYFLLMVIEQGIPGLLFFFILVGAMLFYAQRLYHRIQEVFYKTAAITIGVIIMMLLVVNFLSDLIETDKIGSIFFLCLSILVIVDINTRKEFKQL